MKKIVFTIMLLAIVTVARAFSFSQAAPTGQTLYFDIMSGNTVKVVNPDWDNYMMPIGGLTLPATVEHGGVTYSLTTIGREAFDGCTGLTRITVPEGVTVIEGFAFYGCTALDTIELPTTLTEILSQAFNGTGYVRNADNRDEFGMIYIGQYLVGGVLSSDRIDVREGTLGVSGMAFYYKRALQKLSFPTTLRFASGLSFSDCGTIDTVWCLSEQPPAISDNTFEQTTLGVVIVPCGRGEAYGSAPYWSQFTIVEDTCPPSAIEEVKLQGITVTVVDGGIMVGGADGQQVAVCDMAGRTVASTASYRAGQRIALPSSGLYVILSPGRKALKISYLK